MFLKGDTEMTDKMSEKEIFSKNLKFFIKQKRLNYKEFAAAIDVKYTTVLDWVNGRNFPRIEKLETIANFFKIEKSRLLDVQFGSLKTSLDLHKVLNDTLNVIESSTIVYYKKVNIDKPNIEFVTRTLTQILNFLEEDYETNKKRQEFENMLTFLNTKQEVQNKKQ